MGSVHVGYKFDMSKVARHVLYVTRSPGSKPKISTLDCTTYDREDAASFKVSTKKAAAGASQDLPKLRMGLPTTGPLCSLIRILNVPALFAPRSCKRKSASCLQTIPEEKLCQMKLSNQHLNTALSRRNSSMVETRAASCNSLSRSVFSQTRLINTSRFLSASTTATSSLCCAGLFRQQDLRSQSSCFSSTEDNHEAHCDSFCSKLPHLDPLGAPILRQPRVFR